MKTNAARILDGLGIAYELRPYEVDVDDLTAQKVARDIGLPAEQVFKTLVCRGKRHGVCMAVVPATLELDLRALRKARGERKAHVVPLADVEPLTGYIRGGVTALGAKKVFPVCLDERALGFERISVSAGVRGLQMILSPDDYAQATEAVVGDFSRPPAGAPTQENQASAKTLS